MLLLWVGSRRLESSYIESAHGAEHGKHGSLKRPVQADVCQRNTAGEPHVGAKDQPLAMPPIPPTTVAIIVPNIAKIIIAGMAAIAAFTMKMTIEINGIFTSMIITRSLFSVAM